MMEIISEGGQYTYFKSNPLSEKIAVQLGNTRLGSGYFDHYQDMRQAIKSARANMTICKYVAGDDNSVYFTELMKLLTSGQKLYKAKRWWSISIVELLFALQVSDETTKGESKPQDGTSLDQVNAAYKNKFVAEELIRKRKLKAADDERVGQRSCSIHKMPQDRKSVV